MTFRSQPKKLPNKGELLRVIWPIEQIRNVILCSVWNIYLVDIWFSFLANPVENLFLVGPFCLLVGPIGYRPIPGFSSASERFSYSMPDLPYSGLRDPSTHTFSESSWCQLTIFGRKYKHKEKDGYKDKDKDTKRITETILVCFTLRIDKCKWSSIRPTSCKWL